MSPNESVLQNKSSEECWHFVSEEHESSLSDCVVQNLHKLAVTNFMDWEGNKGQFIGDSSILVSQNILVSGDKELLNNWLTLS